MSSKVFPSAMNLEKKNGHFVILKVMTNCSNLFDAREMEIHVVFLHHSGVAWLALNEEDVVLPCKSPARFCGVAALVAS